MTTSDTQKKLVVIPLYNEESTIASVIQEIRKYYTEDILIINDGSTDRSAQIVTDLADPRVGMLCHCTNLGYGRSLIDAFGYAVGNSFDAVVTIDCDWQHEPRFIPQFFEELRNADVISGSRYFFDNSNQNVAPESRYKINKIITSEINQITDFRLTDTFCGFKAYRVSALKKIHLSEPGYAMPLQFWIQAWYRGLRIKEIPVTRIYLNLNRTFGGGIDDPEKRLQYYRQIIEKEISHAKDCVVNRCSSR